MLDRNRAVSRLISPYFIPDLYITNMIRFYISTIKQIKKSLCSSKHEK